MVDPGQASGAEERGSRDSASDADRARGALLGAAIGDALGQPLEGHRAPGQRDIEIAMSHERDLRWTDDTALTIAFAESLVEVGGLDEDQLALAFARTWRAEPWRGYGPRAAALFESVADGGSWHELARTTRSWGNGAAMRVAPAAVFAAGNITRTLDLARRSALVTHTHPLAVDGAVVQAFAVASALRPGAAGALAVSRRMQEQLDRVDSMPVAATPDDVALEIGHGVDALSSVPAARAVVRLAGGSMETTMRFALALGGDTDTIASMAGAVVGARLGAGAIPKAWLDRLEGLGRLIRLADKLVAANGHGVSP